MRIGLDYTLKKLDWIRIAKIFDPFNTNVYIKNLILFSDITVTIFCRTF